MSYSLFRVTQKNLCIVLILACLNLLSSCIGKNERTIVIIYENDVHCNIDGYAKMKGYAQSLSDTAWVGMTCSGDFLHGGTAGAISNGKYVVDIMKEMHYDVIGLGNHEFDFKVDQLLNLVEYGKLPVVNINFRTTDSDSLFFAPYVIKEYGKRSVAFVGVVTPEAMLSEAYAFYNQEGEQLYTLCEERIVSMVQGAVDEVREQGVDYVVLISHLGEASAKDFLTSHELVEKTRGIDVVLDAHTHSCVPCAQVMNAEGEAVIVSQTGNRFKNIGKLLITSDGRISAELIPLDSIPFEDERIKAVTDSVKHEMESVVSKRVCHSDYAMVIHSAEGKQLVRMCETNAGNLVADAFRYITGANLALNNGGGIRASIPAGDWAYGDVINMLPYNNYLQVISIKGSKLMELLYATTANSPKEDGQFPQISGFCFTLDTVSVGEERVKDVKVWDEKKNRYMPLELDKEYTLCTTDYCVSGGGMYNVLKDETIIKDNIMLYNDAVVKYITEGLGGVIHPKYSSPNGRIVMK